MQKGSAQSEAALREYFETLVENFESLPANNRRTRPPLIRR